MLKVEDVTISRSGKDLLKRINFSLNPNSGILISGPNGIGKSSLLAALAGDLGISKGKISLFDVPISQYTISDLSNNLSIMAQRASFSLPLQVVDLLNHLKLPIVSHELLIDLGIEKFIDNPISKLSGGELQRLFFYIAVLQEAHLYLLDEPISNQDDRGTAVMENWVAKLITSEKMVIVFSHTGFNFLNKLDLKVFSI